MKIKLKNGPTIFKIGKIEFDQQDIGILLLLTALVLLLFILIKILGLYNNFVVLTGIIVASILFRNILIAKGKIKK